MLQTQQTQFVSTTEVAAELLQSMGVELAIFVVSIALAVMFRGATFGKQIGGCQKAVASGQSKPSRANSGRSGKKEVKHMLAPTEATTRTKSVASDVAQKIHSMIDCANNRQCGEAIAIYGALRANGDHKAIKDLTRRGNLIKGPSGVFASLLQCAASLAQCPELVELLLNDMVAIGIDRSLSFYETTMKMLAAKKCYKEALAIGTRLEADGLEPSPVTLSCLISFAVELGEPDRAISFFNRLAACSTPHIRAYMTILRVYSRRHDWTKSLALIRDMQHSGAPIDSLVINIVLSTGIAARELDATKALLTEFSKINLVDTVSYNTVMKGLAQQKDISQALSLLAEMCKTGVKPNAITFNTAIDAAVRSGRVADAWSVLTQMVEAGLSPDKFTCTTLMKGLQGGANSQQLTVILDLLKNVPADSNSSTLSYLFRSAIEAAAQVNDPALTAKAISQMRQQQVMLSAQEHQRLLRVLMREC